MGECAPNTAMWLNVSSEVEWVMLQPWLRWPEVQGVRVEVDGQVLSKGGDVGADQLADTGADPKIRCASSGNLYGLYAVTCSSKGGQT